MILLSRPTFRELADRFLEEGKRVGHFTAGCVILDDDVFTWGGITFAMRPEDRQADSPHIIQVES